MKPDMKFVSEWADAWNRRAVDEILEDFHEDVVFTSPTALAVVGSPVVRGKDALRAYWNKALANITSLRFTVDRALWDPAIRELAILYSAEIDGRKRRVSENLTFNDEGKVVAAEVFHGVPASSETASPRKVLDLKAFVPARDLELSRRFYLELGFTEKWSNDQAAELELAGFRFLLQRFYVKEHAENFMMHLMVEDADSWWEHIKRQGLAEKYQLYMAKPPALQPWGLRVLYLSDPTGVLWHIADRPKGSP